MTETNERAVTRVREGGATRRRVIGGGAALGGSALAMGAVPANASWTRALPAPPHPQPRAARAGTPSSPRTQSASRLAGAAHPACQAARDLFGSRRTPTQETNGDEGRYDDYRASFTKALPHDDLGEVDAERLPPPPRARCAPATSARSS